MLKTIYKKLGIEGDLESSQIVFCNKILNKIQYLEIFHKDKKNVFDALCFEACNELGIRYDAFMREIESILTNGLDFSEFIVRLQIFINLSYKDAELNLKGDICPYLVLVDLIEGTFNSSPIDLGYSLKEYKNKPAVIYKKGVSFLDEKLVLDVLDWLEQYPLAKENYSKSLKFFFQKQYADSITNSYSALEAVAKQVLNTKATLDNDKTRSSLIQKLSLGEGWGKVLLHFSRVSHEFSTRHGGNSSLSCTEEQAEFYLYQTGTYLRLISRVKIEP